MVATPNGRRVGIVGHIQAVDGDEGVTIDHFMPRRRRT